MKSEVMVKAISKTTGKLLETGSTKILVKASVESQPEPTYTEDELYMMSHLIGGEAGASWASDIHQQAVGLVVMNRIGSHLFPDTMEEVIFQRGQYACTWDGNYDKEPSEQVIENAKKVLTGETDIEFPPNVVFQSTQRLGDGVYYEIYDETLNNTTYFCYSNK